MTHEFKKLVQAYLRAKQIDLKTVLATVVVLEGSGYRREGIQMLLMSNGEMTGAVSGGCVEKEVLKQAGSVFKTGIPKIMTYDGRYRLGCEGLLYILIERFDPSVEMIKSFEVALENRESFTITNHFQKEVGRSKEWGSTITFNGKNQFSFDINRQNTNDFHSNLKTLTQKMEPCFKLIIVGAEHDAVQLTQFASLLGWDVIVVTSPSDPQNMGDFPGAFDLIRVNPESFDTDKINEHTAIVLMTHSYVKDLKFLIALKNSSPKYLGLLGPSNRRERLLNEFIEHHPMVKDEFFDSLYGPTGLNIGAETPQEIALSICSEILAVVRRQKPDSLKDKIGKIHCNPS
jgi:xanthine/CO dehydrogenase XdhC/CoxF family maturation factor